MCLEISRPAFAGFGFYQTLLEVLPFGPPKKVLFHPFSMSLLVGYEGVISIINPRSLPKSSFQARRRFSAQVSANSKGSTLEPRIHEGWSSRSKAQRQMVSTAPQVV